MDAVFFQVLQDSFWQVPRFFFPRPKPYQGGVSFWMATFHILWRFNPFVYLGEMRQKKQWCIVKSWHLKPSHKWTPWTLYPILGLVRVNFSKVNDSNLIWWGAKKQPPQKKIDGPNTGEPEPPLWFCSFLMFFFLVWPSSVITLAWRQVAWHNWKILKSEAANHKMLCCFN